MRIIYLQESESLLPLLANRYKITYFAVYRFSMIPHPHDNIVQFKPNMWPSTPKKAPYSYSVSPMAPTAILSSSPLSTTENWDPISLLELSNTVRQHVRENGLTSADMEILDSLLSALIDENMETSAISFSTVVAARLDLLVAELEQMGKGSEKRVLKASRIHAAGSELGERLAVLALADKAHELRNLWEARWLERWWSIGENRRRELEGSALKGMSLTSKSCGRNEEYEVVGVKEEAGERTPKPLWGMMGTLGGSDVERSMNFLPGS
jgi:hypothetical protein